jgi:hypothetical protein
MPDLAHATRCDLLTLREIGELRGDTPHRAGGDRARELHADALAGKMQTIGSAATLRALGVHALATRAMLAAWICAHGRPQDRTGLAGAWAEGRGRIPPPAPPPAIPKRTKPAGVAASVNVPRVFVAKPAPAKFDPLAPMRLAGGMVQWK